MKKLRIRHPLAYCIIAFVLWLAAQNLFGIAGAFADGLFQMNGALLQLISEAGCALAMALLLRRTGRGGLLSERGIGLASGLKYGLPVILLAAVMTVLSLNFSSLQLSPLPIIVCYVTYMLTIGMAEDFLCRGIMAETLLERFGTGREGVLKASAISSLLFGLIHFMNLLSGASLSGVLLQVLNAFLVGMVFAAIYFRTGNLWTVVLIHAVWDFFSLMQTQNGLFVSQTTFAQTLSSQFDIWTLVTMALMLAFSIFMFMRKSTYEAAAIFFDPYVRMQKEERKQL